MFCKGWNDDPHVMSLPGVTRRHFYNERARLGSAYDTLGACGYGEVEWYEGMDMFMCVQVACGRLKCLLLALSCKATMPTR